MAYGNFRSVLTNSQLPQNNSGSPGDVFWVNSSGLLWFVVGDGSLIQLLESVPIPTIGPQGEKGDTGAIGPQGPALFFQGNWQGSPFIYQQGSLVTYNNSLWLANAVSNINNPPPSNPFWTLLGAIPAQTSEIILAIDGAGQPPLSGFKGYITIPYNCTVTGWVILADQAGSAVLDIKWAKYSDVPNTVSIVGSANPQLVSVQKNQGTAAGWNPTQFLAGQIIEVDLISASQVTFITLSINITSD